MRRIAIYSDIHANLTALEAVLADMDALGVTERYCLGDLVGYGPDPAGVIARVRACAHPCVRGNYDDGIGRRKGDCGCYYATDQARAEGEESYTRTNAALDDAEKDFLGALVDDIRLEVGSSKVLLCHGSPRRINEYLLPDRTDAFLLKLALAADVDVVGVGHVHIPYHRAIEAADGRLVHYVSDGSVGKPKDGDPRPCWAELVFGTREEVVAACPDDSAAGPVGASSAEWLGAVFHRPE